MKITFKKPEEILDFVNKVEKYDCAMDMNRGIYVVDGKSILGIMNLGLNNIINLKIYLILPTLITTLKSFLRQLPKPFSHNLPLYCQKHFQV